MLRLNSWTSCCRLLRMRHTCYARASRVGYRRTGNQSRILVCESRQLRLMRRKTELCRTDAVLFTFMERYFQRLEGPLAIQVWGRYLSLVKDLVTSTKDFKSQNFPALRYSPNIPLSM